MVRVVSTAHLGSKSCGWAVILNASSGCSDGPLELRPGDVNQWIRDRIAEASDQPRFDEIDVSPPPPPPRSAPPIESIPEQERTGTRFGMDDQGRIDVLRIPPATDDLQRFHYEEMRHKAEALAGLGQMLGEIAPAINRILEALPEHIEEAIGRQAMVARQYVAPTPSTRMFTRSRTISGLTPRACDTCRG